jgi:hypothetical protein
LDISPIGQQVGSAGELTDGPAHITGGFMRRAELEPYLAGAIVLFEGVAVLENGFRELPARDVCVGIGHVLPGCLLWAPTAAHESEGRNSRQAKEETYPHPHARSKDTAEGTRASVAISAEKRRLSGGAC